MEFNLLIILGIFLSCCSTSNRQDQNRYDAIYSGINWFDQSNQQVNAHGACIVKEGDKYYLFGEYKTDSANIFIGFSCYSSTDLMNWQFERIALPQQVDGLLGPNRIGERVKVMKCPETGEFIMYMHTDDRRYMDPHIGYATCKTINGDYEFQGALLHEGDPIRRWDMGTFQDTDGKGYLLIHHGIIYELSSDYKSAKRIVVSGQEAGESPAMFKSNGIYYWLSSNLTSWERNDNFYLTAKSLEGPWTNKGLIAPEGMLTWNSQCSFVLPVPNKKDTLFMYMGDRWSFPKQGSAATQVWQPIEIEGGSLLVPEFYDSWRFNFVTADWSETQLEKTQLTTEQYTMTGSWEQINDTFASNEKGAILTCTFSGKQFGIKGISNSQGGYARVTIQNNKNKELINTIVDFYSKYEYSSLKFLSPKMDEDEYIVTIEVMGEHGVWYNKAGDVFGSQDDFVWIKDSFIKFN